MLVALRATGLSYTNDDALASPGERLTAAGLALLSDESRGFGLDVTSEGVADRLLDGLYLPDVPPARVVAARRAVRSLMGRRTTLPVRRLGRPWLNGRPTAGTSRAQRAPADRSAAAT